MPTVRVADDPTLARLAAWHSSRRGAPVATARTDDGTPFAFAADTVLVAAEDTDVLEDLVRRGGTVVEEPPLPERPEVLGPDERERTADMERAPRTVRVRFDRPPEASTTRLRTVLERADHGGEQIAFGTEAGARLAAALAPHREERRRVGLNMIGRPFSLPLQTIAEGPGASFTDGTVYGSDPTVWPEFTGVNRMVAAWQLVESVKAVRGTNAPRWIAIADRGFWLDGTGRPMIPSGETVSDFAGGVLAYNLQAEGQPVPGGAADTSSHGNQVAGVAAATVGGGVGTAGSGGSVARPALLHCDYSAEHGMRAAKLCVWWGLDVLNCSWGFWGQSEFWFDSDTWDDTFSWAADNGLITIAAAGNDGLDLPGDRNIRPATRTPRTLTVGMLESADRPAFGEVKDTADPDSNHGSSVWLWAPGDFFCTPDASFPSGSRQEGTSYAAPHVAGVAAMMRFVDPSLSADRVRDLLVATGVPGGGVVSRRLDAYAAVLAALGGALPDTDEPNNTPATARALLPLGGGGLGPAFTGFSAGARTGDGDWWSFDVPALSDVTITLEYYERLANVWLSLRDPDDEVPDLAETAAPGVRTQTGVLRRGRHLIRVGASGPSAYRLVVRLTPAVVRADVFEANDTVDTATRMRFAAPTDAFAVFALGHGPGRFDLTLHRTPTGGMDADHFRLDAPARTALAFPQVSVFDADEPVDVTLLDAERRQIGRWPGVRHVSVRVPESAVSFLRVEGAVPTRYRLGVGMVVDPSVLPGPLEQELQLLPPWWEDPHPEWVRPGETVDWGVDITPEVLAEGAVVLTQPGGVALPAAVTVDVLDADGRVVATGAGGVVDTAGLAAAPHVLRVTVPGQDAGIGIAPVRVLTAPPAAVLG